MSLDLAIVVEYGAKIPDVSWNVQSKVKSDVEAMTGLSVSAVNVSVDSITAPAAEEKQEENKVEKAEEVSETDKEESVSEAADAAEE